MLAQAGAAQSIVALMDRHAAALRAETKGGGGTGGMAQQPAPAPAGIAAAGAALARKLALVEQAVRLADAALQQSSGPGSVQASSAADSVLRKLEALRAISAAATA